MTRQEQTTAAEETPAAEAKVGDLVEMTFGRGQVRHVREDGMLEVEAMGWEMANENRARFILRKDAVKVVPTVYYKMPGESGRPITCPVEWLAPVL